MSAGLGSAGHPHVRGTTRKSATGCCTLSSSPSSVLAAGNARVVPPFQPRHSPLELLEIVRVVSLHVDADAPHTVNGRRWDDGRAGAGHHDAPRAFSIAKRLEVSWPDVLLVAHLEPELAWRRLNNLRADKGRKGITLDRVLLALRQAAVRLNKPGIDRTDYERARREMTAASRRARRGAPSTARSRNAPKSRNSFGSTGSAGKKASSAPAWRSRSAPTDGPRRSSRWSAASLTSTSSCRATSRRLADGRPPTRSASPAPEKETAKPPPTPSPPSRPNGEKPACRNCRPPPRT